MSGNAIVTKTASSRLSTAYGDFVIDVFVDALGREHVALHKGTFAVETPVLVRIHSECITGEVFNSLHCDCAAQLDLAMRSISEAGSGAIVYLRQEGRDIGLTNKIKAYDLQRQGLDTFEANEKLGFPPDARTYEVAAAILSALGIGAARLMTNSPDKVEKLVALGITVAERVPLEIPPNGLDDRYLATKRLKFGHWLTYGT